MDYEALGAALAVVGALLRTRRDPRRDVAGIRRGLRALNGRIDAIPAGADRTVSAAGWGDACSTRTPSPAR